jgi:peptide/nickel transport system ATP-binding protein
MAPLLTVRNLSVTFPTATGAVEAVRDVSFALWRERLGVVGESGSGKSTVGRAVMGLVPPPGRWTADELTLEGLDLQGLSERRFRHIRGRRLAMVLQDPKFALNPLITAGHQIAEAHQTHFRAGSKAARLAALRRLETLGLPDPERVYRMYPHELSGGMGQRVMIAMMLIADPQVLIADEPTSALDATLQRQLLMVIDEQVRARGMGVIFISHNLRLIASFCDRVIVMRGGRIVEACEASRLESSQHPYVRRLLSTLPDLRDRRTAFPHMARDLASPEET